MSYEREMEKADVAAQGFSQMVMGVLSVLAERFKEGEKGKGKERGGEGPVLD